MKRTGHPASLWILALFLLSGCGGGSDGVPGISYTGSTAPAAIADNNAEAIGIAAYQAGERSSNLSGPMGASPDRAAAGSPRVVTLVRALQSFADKISLAGQAPAQPRTGVAPKAIVPFDDTQTDSSGGTMHIALSVDDVTGAFTGSITFDNYHPNPLDNYTVLSGATNVSGQFDSGGELANLRFNFVSFTLDDPNGSVTVGGSVDLAISPSSSTATIDLVFRDNITAKMVWISDYTMVATPGPDVAPADGTPDYVDVNVSGRIYLHDYGYVDILTTVPMRIYADDLNPSSGTLVMTGALNRSVRLVVINDLSFNLDADLDADDTYEWTSLDNPYSWM